MKNEQATWEKAHRKLKREVRRAHKKVRRRTDDHEATVLALGGDEEAGLRALAEADCIERRVFRKKRKKLRKLARKEKIAFDHYTDAEAERAASFAVFMLED